MTRPLSNQRWEELDRIFRAEYKNIFRRVSRCVRNQSSDEIADQISRCFVKLLEVDPDAVRSDALVKYIVTCACNGLLDRIKHSRYEENPGWEQFDDGAPSHPMMGLKELRTPPTAMAAKRFFDCIARCIASYRFATADIETALMLYIFEGLSSADIAKAIGRTSGATRKMISTQMSGLRAHLMPCQDHLET